MTGKATAARRPAGRGGIVRAGLAASLLLIVAAIGVGCETAPPPRQPDPLSFTNLPPLVFDLGRIEVVERPAAPDPADVGHLFTTPPAAGVRQWVQERLRASGAEGLLRVTIEEASARATPLATNAGFEDLFTEEQAERLDLRLRVTVEPSTRPGRSAATPAPTRSAPARCARGSRWPSAISSTTSSCWRSSTTTTRARCRRCASTSTSTCAEAAAVNGDEAGNPSPPGPALPDAPATHRGAGAPAPTRSRPRGSTGGEEAHALTAAEGPPHDHSAQARGFSTNRYGAGTRSDYNLSGRTGSAGNGQPHNNMQPSIVARCLIKP